MKKKLLLDSLIIILFIICFISIWSNVNATNESTANKSNRVNVVTTNSNSQETKIVTTTGLKGDLDGNNYVGVEDASLLLSYVATQELNYTKPTDEVLKMADIDEDKMITIEDAKYILQYYAMAAAGLKPTWEETIIVSRLTVNRDKIPSKTTKPEYKANNTVDSTGIVGSAQVGVKQYDIYTQLSPASWSNTKYWNGTISSDGCGITTLATIIAGYGWDVTPLTIAKEVPTGKDMSLFVKELEKYNIKSHLDQVNKDKIIENLKKGNAVIVNIDNGAIGERDYIGHYVALLAIDDDGQILLADPASDANTGWFDESKIFSDKITGTIYIDN